MLLEEVALVPRAALFGNPERGGCQISPCGRWLAFCAPHDGVMNLWIGEWGPDLEEALGAARAITNDRNRGIYEFFWSYDGVHLLYMQDRDGDENAHIFCVPATGGVARDMTPFPGARASLAGISRIHRDALLVSINNRDARFDDLYRLELATGALTLVRENPGYAGFVTDEDYQVRLAMAPNPDGTIDMLTPDGDEWKLWRHIEEEDASNTWPAVLHRDGHTLYMLDSRGRDKAALYQYDLEGSSEIGTCIAEHDGADISGVWTDNETKEPLAWTATVERREIHLLGDALKADVTFLNGRELGQWRIASRTENDRRWIVAGASDVSTSVFYSYDRDAGTLTYLYSARPQLASAPLARMQSTRITTRDGLEMVSYLTLPIHVDVQDRALISAAPVPLILLVHGGPQARDEWGFDPQHQWLANRGYAVLGVNFRASTGFGKAFIAAGDGEWGGRMDDDLVDAVRWAIDRGVADPARICIMGASYGGYATLWGLTAHPDLYACGVDIVGPSNLATLAVSIPPYWESAKKQLFRMIGDVDTSEGQALMQERSPVHRAARIAKPLLIGQGANDPRVKQAESDQMVAAMKENGVPVTYVLFPDEGHGFHRPANSIRFNAITEEFLAKYLGGRVEPLAPGEVEGNTAVMVENSLA
ncbi:S9 family peptidase [Sphingobium lactosutens]|uniref:S9 family peptidase n=1 Tax=Sphingobium lactosutens TaxID=522773 RepID=UPI0015BA1E29|nr:S9 family peptidase [Sphingobium lactosutens]NWK94586.1 S9 family peptidase [Sphingobium lactosutens]